MFRLEALKHKCLSVKISTEAETTILGYNPRTIVEVLTFGAPEPLEIAGLRLLLRGRRRGGA